MIIKEMNKNQRVFDFAGTLADMCFFGFGENISVVGGDRKGI